MKKTKRIFKIIVFNLIFLLVILLCIDYLIYTKYKNDYLKTIEQQDLFPPISYIENYKAEQYVTTSLFEYSKKYPLIGYFRPISGKEYKNKKSAIIFGCSFAHGFGLKDEQTISEKLAQKTKRTVFNFGIDGAGIQHMLKLIKHNNLYETINIPPENIIYIYIPEHIDRLRANLRPHPMMTNGRNLKYKIKNNALVIDNSMLDLFSKTFIVKSILYQLDFKRDNKSTKNKEYNKNLTIRIFIESKKLLQEKYPDIKFTILKYETEDDEFEDIEPKEMWKELEKEGFIIIKSSDLIGRKYKYNSKDTNEDLFHPSEAAWDLLIPPLVEKLNL